MKIELMIRNAMQSLFEAAGRIFSPTDDQYPEIGVQPFEGEPYDDREQSY